MQRLHENHSSDLPCGSIAAVATLSNKTTNQDACRVLRNEDGQTLGVVIADGVGSHYGGDVASAAVVEAFHDFVLGPDDPWRIDLAFERAQTKLARTVQKLKDEAQLPKDLDFARAFSTTAIAIVEDDVGGIRVCYLGNGAVLNLRGDFDQLPPGRLLPTSANLLNPHIFWENGRSVLDRYIGPNTTRTDCRPSGLTFLKDARFGDIVIATTDGILSQEEVLVGRDHRGHIFLEAKPAIVLLFKAISDFFLEEVTERALETCLERYLVTLLEHNLVDDDVTIAVLLSSRAVAYRKSKQPSPVEGETLS